MSRSSSGVPRAEDVADRLHSAAIHLLRRLRREDRATGLSPACASALSVAVFSGPVTLGDLARAEGVRPPTITRIVALLERDGLVARRSAGTDRRVVRITATAKGRRALQRGRERRVRRLMEMLGGLDRRQVQLLDEAVALIEQILQSGRGAT